jgi:hypothetical protein
MDFKKFYCRKCDLNDPCIVKVKDGTCDTYPTKCPFDYDTPDFQREVDNDE